MLVVVVFESLFHVFYGFVERGYCEYWPCPEVEKACDVDFVHGRVFEVAGHHPADCSDGECG